MDKSENLIFILPHFRLMEEYARVSQSKKNLFDFYYKSLDSFDRILSNTEQSFGKFINLDSGKQLTGRYAYIILQTKNALDSFFGHYFILKNNLCNASIPLLRFCYETLLKNYFYLTLPKGEILLVKYHDYKAWQVRNKLYTPESLKNSHQKLYSGLSTKSHAGIISSSSSYSCSSETYTDSLEFGIWLLYGYFVFLLDCFNQFILDTDRDKIKIFFGEFSEIFGGIFPTFIPDREEINLLLKFKNIEAVNPENVEGFKREKSEYIENS